MKTELIIRSSSSDIDFALLREGKLIALNKEKNGHKFSVGDVFLAKVGKILPGLNATFVNVGHEKDGFLHYHDLGPQLRSLLKFLKQLKSNKENDYSLENFEREQDINKHGKITEVLKPGDDLLVQIVKEPISTKGPRISSELSIAGRYLVLVPFSKQISFSQKIKESKEKQRLKSILEKIRPKGFGVIARTVAVEKKATELESDLNNSMDRWLSMCKKIQKSHYQKKPIIVLNELNRASSILRDIFNDTFTSIVTNDENLFSEIKEYMNQIAPEKQNILKHYKSNYPIFEKFGIERQIKSSFGKTVSMSRGAYLVIEHTEALHVIDVNSGNRSDRATSQSSNALEVNLIAASEIARQIRLRDMGGIIVVDFIDMTSSENRKKLFEHLRNEMSYDKTKHKILPPSKFGLIQITRQRVRPEMVIKTREPNPNFINNTIEVEAPITLIDTIENELNKKLANKKNTKIQLNTHPFVAAYLKKGLPSIQHKWWLKHKRWIKIYPRDAYQYLQFNFSVVVETDKFDRKNKD